MSAERACACPLPAGSRIAHLAVGASCSDAYRIRDPLPSAPALVTYQAMLAQQPWWMGTLMALRNAVVRPLGLKTGTLQGSGAALHSPQVGDRLGLFSVENASTREVVLTVDDVHLQVWLSLHKQSDAQGPWVTVSSVVRRHPNALGRLYLGVVWPVHQRIVPRFLEQAVPHVRSE